MKTLYLHTDNDPYRYGYCELRPDIQVDFTGQLDSSLLQIGGKIRMRESLVHSGPLELNITIHGLNSTQIDEEQIYYISAHEYGDLSDICDSLGEGLLDPNPRFDLVVEDDGISAVEILSNDWTLIGHQSLIGRSFMLHRCPVDNSNCGEHIACCVIGFVDSVFW
ncbi:extracellular superoxide dismutase [Cu-Zn]-like [Glandiceps talaboti]